MNIGAKLQEISSPKSKIVADPLLLPKAETSQQHSQSPIRKLYSLVAEKRIGTWERVNKPRPDGVLVEFSFGEAPFLAGETNSKLENLISLLEGGSLHNVFATVVLRTGDRPNGHELCLSCPVAVRGKISIDKLPRQDVIDDIFRSNKRDYKTQIADISLSDVTHLGLFQARQESIIPKWESQLNTLRRLLSQTMNLGS